MEITRTYVGIESLNKAISYLAFLRLKFSIDTVADYNGGISYRVTIKGGYEE